MSLFSRIHLGLSLLVLSAMVGHMALATPHDRIVTVGGSITEIVYALGQQDRLVARDTTSSFPEAAWTFQISAMPAPCRPKGCCPWPPT